ncbi:hypothetical protein BGZ90_008250 [Linnemannia elongata]|nr:hypothetical protein BGZ90_008250 [Linnemannia elongata]
MTIDSSVEYRCNGIKSIRTLGKCNETDPTKFVKGSTIKCLECHTRYYANKMGKKVSEIEVTGEPYKAKVVIKDNGKAKKTNEKFDNDKTDSDNEKKISKKDKIAKLEKELEKANNAIALLTDRLEQIAISSDLTFFELNNNSDEE